MRLVAGRRLERRPGAEPRVEWSNASGNDDEARQPVPTTPSETRTTIKDHD